MSRKTKTRVHPIVLEISPCLEDPSADLFVHIWKRIVCQITLCYVTWWKTFFFSFENTVKFKKNKMKLYKLFLRTLISFLYKLVFIKRNMKRKLHIPNEAGDLKIYCFHNIANDIVCQQHSLNFNLQLLNGSSRAFTWNWFSRSHKDFRIDRTVTWSRRFVKIDSPNCDY